MKGKLGGLLAESKQKLADSKLMQVGARHSHQGWLCRIF
jgi:hypothetical protein